MKNNWYVITGAPSSGKTTIINFLKKKGHTVTHEVGRKYFEGQMALGFTVDQIRENPTKLQTEILNLQAELEKSFSPEEIVFFDRGIPDGVSYFEFFKVEAPDVAKKHLKNSYYKKVFFLQPLPVRQDNVRVESRREAREISKIIYNTYSTLGLEVIKVPVMSRKKRLQFILDHIDK